MSTKHIVQFADSSTGQTPDPVSANEKLKFRNLILKPSLRERSIRWDVGVNWIRILPRIQGSLYGWMMRAEVIQPPDGQSDRLPSFCHPKSFERGARSPFDDAHDWFKKEAIQNLFHREKNPHGFKLTARSVGVCWAIHTGREPGEKLILVDSSLYDGAWGGSPGLSYKIWTEANQVDTEPNSPTYEQKVYPDITDKDAGNLVLVEKKRPEKGDRYSSYIVRIGKTAAPIEPYWEALTEEETSLVVPLENVFHRPSEQEQHEMLKDYIGPKFYRQIFGGGESTGLNQSSQEEAAGEETHTSQEPVPPKPKAEKPAEAFEPKAPVKAAKPAEPAEPAEPAQPAKKAAEEPTEKAFSIQEISKLMGSKEGVITLLESFDKLKASHRSVLLEVAKDFQIDTSKFTA
jgi:hypothetical protein